MKKLFYLPLFFLLVSCSGEIDNSNEYNFTYTTSIYDIDINFSYFSSNFAKADAILIESRISDRSVEDAIPYYEEALKFASGEEKAILYETLGSITGNNFYYYKAYEIWKELDNNFRKNIDFWLFLGISPKYKFVEYELSNNPLNVSENVTSLRIGDSFFFLDENDILVSQVDRVTRDWLSSKLQNPYSGEILTVFSEEYDVESIGWHEGGRIAQYKEIVNFAHIPAVGTIVRKINSKWYAPNENGIFMFEVPIDKVQYPTTRFLDDNLALIVDTHGINMLVEQAVNKNASLVMGCCDHIGKINAAMYLNEKGIRVICNTDKYLPLVIGQTNLTYGSIPFEENNGKVKFGNRPIILDLKEKLIVLNSTDNYGLTYYSTPTIYFENLEQKTAIDFNLTHITINDYGQMNEVVSKAELEKAKVIAARVYDERDYIALKSWLEKSPENRLILFHTEPYPYGYKILREFSEQTTFDELNPVFY
jgi:hypothetical protein